MKNLLSLICLIFLICSCSKTEEQKPQQAEQLTAPTIKIDDSVIYTFDLNTLKSGCISDSEMICAINNTIKCTINPQFTDCEAAKDTMPEFVFMQDESLQRPTSQSYKISKLKPLPDGTIEVYTQSTCNGNWFGLCNGNIIFVMVNKDGRWIVKDLYAVES